MKKQRKILIGVVMCLIFLCMPLSGCKFTSLLKGDPEFKEITFSCEDKDYQIKIPFDMPDFTQFLYKEVAPITPVLAVINYYTPDGKKNKWGSENHYRFIFSMIPGECPGVLILATFIDDEMGFWLYDEKGNPYGVSAIDAEIWIKAWNEQKMSEMMKQQEQQKNPGI